MKLVILAIFLISVIVHVMNSNSITHSIRHDSKTTKKKSLLTILIILHTFIVKL